MQPRKQPNLNLVTEERRRVWRHDVSLAAKAGIYDGAPVLCTVRNISPMGALLEFREAVHLPKQFRITIDSAMFTADCEVRHHTDREAGVMFISNRMEALAAFG